MKDAADVALDVANEINPDWAWAGYHLSCLARAIFNARMEGEDAARAGEANLAERFERIRADERAYWLTQFKLVERCSENADVVDELDAYDRVIALMAGGDR